MKVIIFILSLILLNSCVYKNINSKNTSGVTGIDLSKEYTYDEYKKILNSISENKPYPDINSIPNR